MNMYLCYHYVPLLLLLLCYPNFGRKFKFEMQNANAKGKCNRLSVKPFIATALLNQVSCCCLFTWFVVATADRVLDRVRDRKRASSQNAKVDRGTVIYSRARGYTITSLLALLQIEAFDGSNVSALRIWPDHVGCRFPY